MIATRSTIGSLFIVSTMDVPVKYRERSKKQQADQVLKPLDVGVKINNRVNLLYLSNIKKKIDHLISPWIMA